MTRFTSGFLLGMGLLCFAAGCQIGPAQDVGGVPFVPGSDDVQPSPPDPILMAHTNTKYGVNYHPDSDPSGRLLCFASTRHAEQPDIYLKNFDSAAVTRLTDNPAADAFPKFSHSRDRVRIAFASNRDGSWNIYIIDALGGGSLEQVTDDSSVGWDNIAPSFSPDDVWVVFSTRKGQGRPWILRARNRQTGALVELGAGLFPDWSVNWRIAYQRPRERDERWFSVLAMTFDPLAGTVSPPSVLAEGADYACINPAWSSDGRFLSYATVHHSLGARVEGRMDAGDNIWVVAADGSETPRQITFDAAPDWNPTWWKTTREGKSVERLVFVSARDNAQNLYSVAPLLDEPGVVEAEPFFP